MAFFGAEGLRGDAFRNEIVDCVADLRLLSKNVRSKVLKGHDMWRATLTSCYSLNTFVDLISTPTLHYVPSVITRYV